MRALGIEIQASALCWLVLDGDAKGGEVEIVKKQPLPTSEKDEIGNLCVLKGVIGNILVSYKVDAIGIIRADQDCSAIRAKMECMVQLAAKEAGISCRLVPVQTVNAAKRNFEKTVDDSMEGAFWGGKAISPAYLTKPVYCAWVVLRG